MSLKKMSWILAAALVICVAGASQIYAAVDAFLTIEGTKQGAFRGAASGAGSGKITISDFSYVANAPADKATGQLVGRRMHSAITIRKTVDQASPQLMAALNSNETLKTVYIEFYHPGPRGPEVFKTIRLTNAVISAVHVTGAGEHRSEEVTFTAETENIEMMTAKGGKTATDDWLSRN
ncbi:MAG TPA: type VI secretion system tube protein TssD [Candidatus Acidoferrales bacterium]|jgi:type VI secretion system Hcp family effector|nr:type VI secretion system tube protein TssD [Candidatus Acidoferrales bacterium]